MRFGVQQVKLDLSPVGQPNGEGWVLPLAEAAGKPRGHGYTVAGSIPSHAIVTPRNLRCSRQTAEKSIKHSIRGLGLHEEPGLPGICNRPNLRAQIARRRASPRFARIDSLDVSFSAACLCTSGTPATASARRILQGLQESMAQRWYRVARSCHIAATRGCRLGNRDSEVQDQTPRRPFLLQ